MDGVHREEVRGGAAVAGARGGQAEKQPGILPEVLYDLAVIRLAAGDRDGAKKALERALQLNPKLRQQSEHDPDLEKLR